MKNLTRGWMVILTTLASSSLLAQQATIGRKNLASVQLEQKVSKVEIQEISFPAGQLAPKHMHPCPVVGYIKSGSVLFQVEGKDPVILKAGDSFYEPKQVTILHFDNASKEEPMSFVAFYLKEGGEENVKMLH